MAESKAVEKPSKKPAPVPDTVKRYQEMALAIPQGGEDTAMMAILDRLAATDDPSALSAPWDSASAEDLFERVLIVDSLKRLPSDFEDGLGLFLVVQCHDPSTGEAITWTTSAMSVVAQLVKAHSEGWLPLKVELVQSDRPTASGYRPQHLRVYGRAEDF